MIYIHRITREMLREYPYKLFVFGDNMVGKGYGGQAKEMRDEPNAIGIPTKHRPDNTPDAFFSDRDFPVVKDVIDKAFIRLVVHIVMGGDVVWPKDGIGTGLAQLPKKAPLIWNYIEVWRKALDQLTSRTAQTGALPSSPAAPSEERSP